MGGAYWYFNNYKTITTKQLFFEHLSNSNIKEAFSANGYKDLGDKLINSNSEIVSDISFSTNIKNENLEEIDVSKFLLKLKNQNDVKNSKSFNELGINYSGNEIFKVKLITNKDSIGIASDEIVNKYVGVHYDKLQDFLGIDVSQKDIDNLFNLNKIELTEEEKNKFVNENISKISEMISEEKFTVQENIAINKGNESVPVKAYNLTLNQEELNNICIELLNNLKNNKDLLNKLTENENISQNSNTIIKARAENTIETDENNFVFEENQTEENGETVNSQNDINNENNNENNSEDLGENPIEFNAEQIPNNLDPIQGETTEFNENQVVDSELGTQELELLDSANLDFVGEESNFDDLNVSTDLKGYSELINLLLGIKVEKSLEEIQDMIDDCIKDIKSSEGKGLNLTIYVSEEKTEKISIVLPNENTIDLEILKKSNTDNNIKVTYLYKGTNSILSLLNTNNLITYSAEDDITKENDGVSDKTNGFTLEINKVQGDSNLSLDLTYSFIENEEINKKINIKSNLEGATTSSSIKNSAIITISTNENETKAVIDSKMKFSNKLEIEDLVDENCLFLETLSPEDYEIVMQDIKNKIDEVWAQKKEQFNFIDTNNRSSSVVQQNINNLSNNVTRDEARDALKNRITDMINEAQENNLEFTIQNLADLQIEGYEVSSVVNEGTAAIVVDIYTFNVDSEFNITDTE